MPQAHQDPPIPGSRSEPPPASWAWLGRVPFAAAAALQERLRAEILAGVRSDVLLLCEHDPVISLGRSAEAKHVVASETQLREHGITVVSASRGGDVTYHGPGQLVGYPIFRLRRGVLAHLEAMAAGIIAVLADEGIAATWRRACPGVWVGDDKICAFGVNVHRRVAIHGFALNISPDLEGFRTIVPCGLTSGGVTSVGKVRGRATVQPADWAPRVADAFARSFALPMIEARERNP